MANFRFTPTSYREARDIFRQHAREPRGDRYRFSARYVRLGYATELHAAAGWIGQGADIDDAPAYVVRQHYTNVVTFRRNGAITLNHGGWCTATTVDRMDTFTPEELRVNGRDIMARRSDADPRIIVSRVTWHDPIGTIDELATLRPRDNAVHLIEGINPATRRTSWGVTPSTLALSEA